jgi:DNA-binding beta-propeller fold protein YncE
MKHRGSLISACLSAALLAACHSGGNTVLPPNGVALLPTSNLIPASEKVRLYVSGGRAIRVYKLPITPKSRPVATLKTGKGEPTGMAFDPMGRLFVANLSNKIQVFTQPIVDGSVPSFTLATGTNPYNVTFDSTGNAVVAEDRGFCGIFCPFHGEIEVFTAPISKSSTVSYRLYGGYATVTAGFNPDGNLLTEIEPVDCTFHTNKMYEYASPLRKKPPIKHFPVECQYGPTGLAFDSAGNMYLPTKVGLEVYQLNPRRKLFTIKAPVSEGYLAFDTSGNLYVTTDNRKLLKFSPPFSASSLPVVALDLPHSPAGVAIGP